MFGLLQHISKLRHLNHWYWLPVSERAANHWYHRIGQTLSLVNLSLLILVMLYLILTKFFLLLNSNTFRPEEDRIDMLVTNPAGCLSFFS